MTDFYKVEKERLPLVALRGIWIFPHMVMHFDVGRQQSLAAVEKAMLNDSKILLCSQKDFKVEDPTREDIYEMGTIAEIKQTLKLPNDAIRVLVEGVSRAKISELYTGEDGLSADAFVYRYDEELKANDSEMKAAMRLVLDDVKEYINYSPLLANEIMFGLMDIEDPGRLADVIASYLQLKIEDYYLIISELDLYTRLEKLHGILRNEIELMKIEDNINKKVKTQIDKTQREYYLKEQLNVIKSELGESEFDSSSIDEYKEKIENSNMPEYAVEACYKELDRMSMMPSTSPELNISRTYLDYVLDLPWKTYTEDEEDINKSWKILEEDHFGLKDVKERVVEYLAVVKKTGGLKGPIICLVGPPGVGKTSIARSIARAMNREFVSMRLGGVRDEAEIRGHRKTYIAAMPGKIINLMTKAGSMNPVFLLDEIDKIASDFRGDPASALLEVLDPEQNNEFVDHFIDLPFDLSDVMFITTANSLSTIPSALRDRMEIIEVASYTYEEKFNIAKKYLLVKNLEKHGLTSKEFKITDGAIKDLINSYTREAGVRGLERLMAKLMRKAVKEMLKDKLEKISITINNLEDYAGPRIFLDEALEKKSMVGVVTGLAWTEVGGEILQIEAGVMPGNGKVQLTGKLGEVMKESAMAGFSYIRSNQKALGIQDENFYNKCDIHVHIPEGAVPKDGPSAGISMATAMISALTGKKVVSNLAMTGEITLRGRVLPIGGVKEKVLAANRYKITRVMMPQENKKDIKEIPEEILKNIEIIYVSHISEVLDIALEK